jgi:hypothetical protein
LSNFDKFILFMIGVISFFLYDLINFLYVFVSNRKIEEVLLIETSIGGLLFLLYLIILFFKFIYVFWMLKFPLIPILFLIIPHFALVNFVSIYGRKEWSMHNADALNKAFFLMISVVLAITLGLYCVDTWGLKIIFYFVDTYASKFVRSHMFYPMISDVNEIIIYISLFFEE